MLLGLAGIGSSGTHTLRIADSADAGFRACPADIFLSSGGTAGLNRPCHNLLG